MDGNTAVENVTAENTDQQLKVREQIKARRRHVFAELCSNVTLHGLRYLGEENGSRKYSWILIMMTAISFSFVLFFNTILEFPSQSITEFAVERNLDKLEFPTITICNSNSPVYAINAYETFPVNITHEQFIKFYNDKISHKSANSKDSLHPAVVQRILDDLYRLNYTTYREIQGLFEKHKADDFFDQIIVAAVRWFKCQYDVTDCGKDDMKLTLHWELSMCQQINGFDPNGTSLSTNKYGHPYGLMLIMNAISKSFHTSISIPVDGMTFLIHPYGVPHHLVKNTVSVFAQPGSWTQVEIEVTEVQRLPKPYDPHCGEVPFKMLTSMPYTKAACEIDTILRQIYEQCRCIGWEFEGYVEGDLPICNVTQMPCYYDVRNKGVKDLGEGTNERCPVECMTTKYSIVTSELSFGNEALYKRVMDYIPNYNKTYEETKEYVKDNVVAVRIGFKSLTKRVETYKPAVSWYGLIGTVGGSVGLCLGFSVVTAFEGFFFIFDYIYAPWHIKRKLKRDSSTAAK